MASSGWFASPFSIVGAAQISSKSRRRPPGGARDRKSDSLTRPQVPSGRRDLQGFGAGRDDYSAPRPPLPRDFDCSLLTRCTTCCEREKSKSKTSTGQQSTCNRIAILLFAIFRMFFNVYSEIDNSYPEEVLSQPEPDPASSRINQPRSAQRAPRPQNLILIVRKPCDTFGHSRRLCLNIFYTLPS